MAIYGIGAKYNGTDISNEFIKHGIVATGWDDYEAPDIHEYFKALNAGDIVYLKACSYSSNITIKGMGIVRNENILDSTHISELVEIGRNVTWIDKEWMIVNRPAQQKNNVRGNTIYREFHRDLVNTITKIVDTYYNII